MAEVKKRIEWSPSDVRTLIEVWREKLPDLRRQKRHKTVYNEMKNMLEAAGVKREISEIKSKMKNLQVKYREEKKKIGPSGGSPSPWPYYEGMHELLGRLPSNDDALIDEGILGEVEGSFSGNSTQQEEICNDGLGSLSLPLSATSPPQPPLPVPKRGVKRKMAAIQEDLLQEAKRSNDLSKEYETSVTAIMKESNEIAKIQNELMKELIGTLRSNGSNR